MKALKMLETKVKVMPIHCLNIHHKNLCFTSPVKISQLFDEPSSNNVIIECEKNCHRLLLIT